jgi:valyl-tRNA synthetase
VKLTKEPLAKSYDPSGVEDKWYAYWLEKGYFHADENLHAPPYTIVIPPPNITGSLHIGHAFNNTIQDILIRWKRMDGHNALWLPGTDHAGIATQYVVERKLAQEGLDRRELGREEFIRRIWQWREESGHTIINQLKKLGASCDWERERFTMDEGLSAAVRKVFVQLYRDGLIYRGDYITNSCPRCLTVLSELEVEYREVEGHLYYINYPLLGSEDSLTIATTRPETMLGDTAVAVNPYDKRYHNVTGKAVLLPVAEREIPVIADSYVDTAFGTGALKITPAHDLNDFLVGVNHDLPQVKVIGEDGKMTPDAGKYAGLDRYECRSQLLQELEEKGYLLKVEDYRHKVGHCYRCSTPVEPLLSKQWFVSMESLAEPAIKAVKEGRIKLIPSMWEATYYEWMNNIRDWCISRQLWWGHRIPAWYCEDCNEITVSEVDPAACEYCSSEKITQDPDVLDTWFSSGLWPFSTLGWPEKTQDLKTFYPTSVLVTGFDILFFWVARMIFFGLKAMGEVPFSHVYIHGLVRDIEGKKMSKTRGNIIDPLETMDAYGTDAFRFTLAAFAAQGRDIKLSEKRIEGYRKFCNKLWNAARFVLMNAEGFDPQTTPLQGISPQEMELADRWILSRLNGTILEVRRAMEEYKFNDAANIIYHFIWHEYCDWYIELVKGRLQHDGHRRHLAQTVLIHVLRESLELLHPIMPFITEELWQQIPGAGESIMVTRYPEGYPEWMDAEAERDMKLLQDVTMAVRNIRGEFNVPPSQPVDVVVKPGDDAAMDLLNEHSHYITGLAAIERLEVGMQVSPPRLSASAVVGGLDVFVPLEGLLDFEEEASRLEKELARQRKELQKVERKLSNRDFLNKAPPEVVGKEREKQASMVENMEKLNQHLDRVRKLLSESRE